MEILCNTFCTDQMIFSSHNFTTSYSMVKLVSSFALSYVASYSCKHLNSDPYLNYVYDPVKALLLTVNNILYSY